MYQDRSTVRSRVSAAAVARAAGVSTAAVSYVMNGKSGVSEELRKRVLSLATEMGHRPHAEAKVPQAQCNRVVGLVLPNMINPMFPRWAHGVMERAAELGHEVFLATSQDDPDLLTQTVRALVARRVDGLILASAPREQVAALEWLRSVRVPYTQLSRRSDFVPGDFVGIDDAAAALRIMEHVVGHGHTRIASVVGPRYSSASAAREQGFQSAAASLGTDIPPSRRISTSLNNIGGRLAAEELLNSPEPPRAIVCGSDELAIGVMEMLLKRGVRTPEDIAVTGFDGLPHSRSALVGLTTIVQPQIDMAQAAFNLLQQRLSDPGCPFQNVILPHELWVGRTCGCPPSL